MGQRCYPCLTADFADMTRVLRSAGCSTLRQWDLTRAVPRLVRDVKLEKGDIMGIATRKGFVYTCGADGSMRYAPCPSLACRAGGNGESASCMLLSPLCILPEADLRLAAACRHLQLHAE